MSKLLAWSKDARAASAKPAKLAYWLIFLLLSSPISILLLFALLSIFSPAFALFYLLFTLLSDLSIPFCLLASACVFKFFILLLAFLPVTFISSTSILLFDLPILFYLFTLAFISIFFILLLISLSMAPVFLASALLAPTYIFIFFELWLTFSLITPILLAFISIPAFTLKII